MRDSSSGEEGQVGENGAGGRVSGWMDGCGEVVMVQVQWVSEGLDDAGRGASW